MPETPDHHRWTAHTHIELSVWHLHISELWRDHSRSVMTPYLLCSSGADNNCCCKHGLMRCIVGSVWNSYHLPSSWNTYASSGTSHSTLCSIAFSLASFLITNIFLTPFDSGKSGEESVKNTSVGIRWGSHPLGSSRRLYSSRPPRRRSLIKMVHIISQSNAARRVNTSPAPYSATLRLGRLSQNVRDKRKNK